MNLINSGHNIFKVIGLISSPRTKVLSSALFKIPHNFDISVAKLEWPEGDCIASLGCHHDAFAVCLDNKRIVRGRLHVWCILSLVCVFCGVIRHMLSFP